MKSVIRAAVVALVGVGLVGCKSNKPAADAQPAAMDPTPITPPAHDTSAPPVVVQPAPVADAPMKEAGSTASISGRKYTVQKGDTLFNIATRKYGHGSAANIKKIQSANPSLKGSTTLKVGQVLTLP